MECVQEDRNNPLPCTEADKDKWGRGKDIVIPGNGEEPPPEADQPPPDDDAGADDDDQDELLDEMLGDGGRRPKRRRARRPGRATRGNAEVIADADRSSMTICTRTRDRLCPSLSS
jgi:hypothetical protein